MFRRLKLLIYLREINLSSEETLALIRRLETNSYRPEDYVVPPMPLAAPSKGRAARWGIEASGVTLSALMRQLDIESPADE